ncbi:PP2C family protein-serine/threonine phosphatase [Streptomyces sp. NPDC058461]|uniref:PP2C family protein-serine/threonine phosphatase n=1 Tax=Streptomyces sp. NPDC058461 TaxID=3346509 RepID=UPI003654AC26
MSDREWAAGQRPDGLPAALSDPVRLAAVAATGLLDSGPEEIFDDLASLAARITGAGRAFVTLVDAERSVWKSCVGVEADGAAALPDRENPERESLVRDGPVRTSPVRTSPVRENPVRENPVRESFCYFLVGLGGAPFVVEDARTDPRTRDHPAVGPMRIGAGAGFPLLSPDGQVLGGFCVVDESPRVWSSADLATLATLARSVSTEIHLRQTLAESRSAHRVSADLAHTLQQGLLPPALRPVPGLEAAASYLPASLVDRSDVEVGGDFYDLFHTHGPYYGAVLGDVCGKGVEAAQVTSLARYTIRADAGSTASPADLLDRLNTAMLDQRAPRFLTAVYTTFRVTRAGVAGRIALAGHPPGLVRRADGRVQQLGTPGTLLGVLKTVSLTDVRYRLAPGDLLLLYTDGASEARPRPGTRSGEARALFGEEELAAALAATHGMDAGVTVKEIGGVLAAHHGGWASDDTALLALRVPPRS